MKKRTSKRRSSQPRKDRQEGKLSKRRPYNPYRFRVVDAGEETMAETWRMMRPAAGEIHVRGIDQLVEESRLLQFVCVDGKRSGILGWGTAWRDFPERNIWACAPVWNSPQTRELIVRNLFFVYREISGDAYGGALAVMEAALDHLPGHWRKHTGVTPVLAEAEIYHSYPANYKRAFSGTGWFQVSRWKSTSLYMEQYLKELNPAARQSLRAMCRKTSPVEGHYRMKENEND